MTDDLDESYRTAFGNKIGYGKKPALILIDFVEAYFDPTCDLYAGPTVNAALASALRIREAAHAKGLLVVLTRVAFHKQALDGGRFFQKARPLRYFLEGAPMGAWPAGLVPREDELVITKQHPSAFFGTSLASTLASRGVDCVLLTGLSTSGCVRASCVDAMSCGFIPNVVRDACADRHPAPHEANLFDMEAKYADVISEVEAIAYLKAL